MGHIGNTVQTAFTSFDKQTITGTGGTTYTLTHSVANEQEIEVFVNNVRQEPSVAYNVSGNTLTMTGNVLSTDDFYVVFQGKAQQSVTHPTNSALQATTGTFSGALSATTGTFTGDLTVDTDTLVVDSTNNRVGIGTTTPAVNLEVDASTTNGLVRIGQLQFKDPNGSFVSGTDGFYIFPFTDGNIYHDNYDGGFVWRPAGAESMRILSGGDLHLGGTGQSDGKLTITGKSSGGAWGTKYITDVTSGSYYFINFCKNDGTAAQVGSITSNGTSTGYNTSSDHRLKENVVSDWDATTRLKQLNPVRFNFIANADTTVDGFLAHEVQSVVPEAITGTHDEVDDDGNPVYQGIDQSKLVPLLVKTIQELEARVAALENA